MCEKKEKMKGRATADELHEVDDRLVKMTALMVHGEHLISDFLVVIKNESKNFIDSNALDEKKNGK